MLVFETNNHKSQRSIIDTAERDVRAQPDPQGCGQGALDIDNIDRSISASSNWRFSECAMIPVSIAREMRFEIAQQGEELRRRSQPFHQ
jgi:hypothetical protein